MLNEQAKEITVSHDTIKANEQATSKEITVSHDTMKVNEQATSKENAECHDTNVIPYFSDSHFFYRKV